MRWNPIVCLILIAALVSIAALVIGGCGQASTIRPDNKGAAEQLEPKKASDRTAGERAAPDTDPSEPGVGMVEVQVVHVGEGPHGGAVVVLRERFGEQRLVPMMIGESEAGAISLRLFRQHTVRPLTHELIETILAKYGIRIVKLEVDDLKDGIFLGRLFLQDPEGTVTEIDTRPSDGIALSLGAEAPIFMSIEVVESAGHTRSEWQEESPESDEDSQEEQPGTL